MIIANGHLAVFFERPIAGVLGVATLLIWAILIWQGIRRSLTRRRAGTVDG
jgi:TctA family transporter